MTVPAYHRDRILEFAAALTEDKSDPEAVKANAAPILRWLGEAADESDQDARYMALGRHWSNAYFATPSRLWPSEDSARFLASAEQYYAFLTA